MLEKINNWISDFFVYRILRLDDAAFQKRVDDYNQLMKTKIKKHWLLLLTIVLIPYTFAQFFVVGLNISESLPDYVFVTHKGDTSIVRNHYVHFRWHGGGPYEAGFGFIKIIKGVPGDVVSMDEKHNFYVNGEYVGTAKSKSKKGVPLQPGFTGVIPEHHFYAFAPHKDSLDSRYALTGLISESDIIGRAYPVF